MIGQIDTYAANQIAKALGILLGFVVVAILTKAYVAWHRKKLYRAMESVEQTLSNGQLEKTNDLLIDVLKLDCTCKLRIFRSQPRRHLENILLRQSAAISHLRKLYSTINVDKTSELGKLETAVAFQLNLIRDDAVFDWSNGSSQKNFLAEFNKKQMEKVAIADSFL